MHYKHTVSQALSQFYVPCRAYFEVPVISSALYKLCTSFVSGDNKLSKYAVMKSFTVLN
ncbi:hypothetical protein Mapa_001271 [Marchantia paleacea]|nr:hypothetical protein Mapa_001271 [Marchantia paleacea]